MKTQETADVRIWSKKNKLLGELSGSGGIFGGGRNVWDQDLVSGA